jgi:predicted enzyme related to lactoylglutathione lyase
MFYVQVDDVAVAIQRVVQLGGVALVGPITIPNGTFGWVQDPGGNTIGLWKPA